MTYKINGTEIPIQPEVGRWNPRDRFGISGDGHPVYSGVREFTLRWGILDATGTFMLQQFFESVGMTGTAVVDLPRYGYADYEFYAYSGTVVHEPEFGDFFAEHQQNIRLDITNITT